MCDVMKTDRNNDLAKEAMLGFKSEWFKKLALIMGALLCLMVLANAGLTAAIVHYAKDTEFDQYTAWGLELLSPAGILSFLTKVDSSHCRLHQRLHEDKGHV